MIMNLVFLESYQVSRVSPGVLMQRSPQVSPSANVYTKREYTVLPRFNSKSIPGAHYSLLRIQLVLSVVLCFGLPCVSISQRKIQELLCKKATAENSEDHYLLSHCWQRSASLSLAMS